MGKKNEWKDKNVNLKSLADAICNFLGDDDFSEIKLFEDDSNSTLRVQARKKGIMRTLTSRRKSFNIVIEGNSNNFKVSIKGHMGRSMAVGGLIAVGLNGRYQKKIWKFIENSIDALSDSTTPSSYDGPPVTPNNMETKQQGQSTSIQPPPPITNDESNETIKILKKRLAVGEITKEEYFELLDVLQVPSEQNTGVTIPHQEDEGTKFWGCPKCSGALEDQNGQQYCNACNEFV